MEKPTDQRAVSSQYADLLRPFKYDPNEGFAPKVFISATSRPFKSHREHLVKCLAEQKDLECISKPIEQSHIGSDGVSLLMTLHNLVRTSAIVVHLVGESIGWPELPPPQHVNAVLDEVERTIGKPLPEPRPDFNRLSYTQWEAVLAILYGKQLFVYLHADADLKADAAANWPELEVNNAELASQQRHLSWLVAVHHYCGKERAFTDEVTLWALVERDTRDCIFNAKRLHEQQIEARSTAAFKEKLAPTSPRIEAGRELDRRDQLLNQFYGRDWLHSHVADWLNRGTGRFYWLQADAGFGKSRFCSALAVGWPGDARISVAAIVYLQQKIGLFSVLTRIVSQLRQNACFEQEFNKAWEAISWQSYSIPEDFTNLDAAHDSFAEKMIEPLLVLPLSKCQRLGAGEQSSLIIIDGLDEMIQWQDGRPAHPLASLINRLHDAQLPAHRIMLTSRPITMSMLLRNLFIELNPATPSFTDRQDDLKSDAKLFIKEEFPQWSSDDDIKLLLKKSKSSMLYLYYLAREHTDTTSIDKAPDGIAGYYLQKLSQYFPNDPGKDSNQVFTDQVLPCLQVIAAGERASITVADVEDCCGKDNVKQLQSSMRMMIHETAQLMTEQQTKVNGKPKKVFVPFHLSFFDWLVGRQFDEGDDGEADDLAEIELRTNHRFRVHIEEGDRRIAQWALREFDQLQDSLTVPDSSEYWVREGVDHALRTFMHLHTDSLGHSPDAPTEKFSYLIHTIDSLGRLKRFKKPEYTSVVSRALPMLAEVLAQSINHESSLTPTALQAMESVNQSILFDLVKDICSTDITEDVIWWIGRTQLDKDRWSELVDKMLQLEWVVRCSAGAGQAARYRRLTTDSELDDEHRKLAIEEINELLDSTDVNRQEMGCYALGEIAKHEDELPSSISEQMGQWLTKLANIDMYYSQSVLGDIVIDLTLRGCHERVAELDDEGLISPFWRPIWQYTRQDVARVLARRSIDGQALIGPYTDFMEDVRFAERGIRARKALISDFNNTNPIYGFDWADVLEKPELEEEDDVFILEWLLRENVSDNERVDSAINLLLILFTHTGWRVSEKGSALVADIHARTHDNYLCHRILDGLIQQLPSLPPELWRAVYGTAEACYLSRAFDDGLNLDGGEKSTRFDYMARKYYNHLNCDVRGLLVENIAFFVEHPDQGQLTGNRRRTEFPKHYTKEIDHWLLDSDIWVLEHVYQMFLAINNLRKGDLTINKWIEARRQHLDAHPNCLLARIGMASKTPWFELERGEFLSRLQALANEGGLAPSC